MKKLIVLLASCFLLIACESDTGNGKYAVSFEYISEVEDGTSINFRGTSMDIARYCNLGKTVVVHNETRITCEKQTKTKFTVEEKKQ